MTTYAHWLCVTCGFGIPANQWRKHRRACARVTECPRFCDSFPCRKRTCPLYEEPIELPDENPGQLPRAGVVRGLGMAVTRLPDGRWAIRASWLDGPVIGDTWPEAYYAAVAVK